MPWIPLNQEMNLGTGIHSDSSANYQGHQQNYQHQSPSHEVGPQDFGYGPTGGHQQATNQQLLTLPHPQFSSPITGPIPNPHLFPGAIPPLFKAETFDANSDNLSSNIGIVTDNSPDQIPAIINQSHNPPTSTDVLTQNGHGSAEYVDVLPPGAEVVSDSDQISSNHETNPHDNGGSSSDVHTSIDHAAASASLAPIVKPIQTVQQQKTPENNYGTKVSSDGQHIIHIEESPVIDLSQDNNDSNDSKFSSPSAFEDVALQNADGTYGINATWPNGDSSRISWSSRDTAEENSALSASTLIQSNQQEETTDKPTTIAPQNITSLLIQVFQQNNNLTDKQEIYTVDKTETTQRGIIDLFNSQTVNEGFRTTQEPFHEAVIKSYNNFQREMAEAKRPMASIDPRSIHPGAGFSPATRGGHRLENPRFEPSQVMVNGVWRPLVRQQGTKKSKQVCL